MDAVNYGWITELLVNVDNMFPSTYVYVNFDVWKKSHIGFPDCSKLSFLLQIFCASIPGSDDFVLLNTWDGNGALFSNVLCNIQFCAKVKFATLDGNIASVNHRKTRRRRWEMEVSYDGNVFSLDHLGQILPPNLPLITHMRALTWVQHKLSVFMSIFLEEKNCTF